MTDAAPSRELPPFDLDQQVKPSFVEVIMRRIRILMLIVFTCAVSVQWAQAGAKAKITKFDAPGGASTRPQGINSAGTITGFYNDSSSISHGFMRGADGTFTEFDAPGATGTAPLSINSSGTLTGIYVDRKGVIHGFLRSPNGTITELTAGSSRRTTWPEAINDAAVIVGFYKTNHFRDVGVIRAPGGGIKSLTVKGGPTIPTLRTSTKRGRLPDRVVYTVICESRGNSRSS